MMRVRFSVGDCMAPKSLSGDPEVLAKVLHAYAILFEGELLHMQVGTSRVSYNARDSNFTPIRAWLRARA
jgi:hypothetical protein